MDIRGEGGDDEGGDECDDGCGDDDNGYGDR